MKLPAILIGVIFVGVAVFEHDSIVHRLLAAAMGIICLSLGLFVFRLDFGTVRRGNYGQREQPRQESDADSK